MAVCNINKLLSRMVAKHLSTSPSVYGKKDRSKVGLSTLRGIAHRLSTIYG